MTLGCGEYRVVITNRCGTFTMCDVTQNVVGLNWGRVMDDTSQAVITIGLEGDETTTCCACLGETRSWIHSVVLYRDGKVVWGPGPIVNILYTRTQVVVTARDISAWLDARVIHNDYVFKDKAVTDIAQTLIEDAFSPDDPCDLITALNVTRSDDPTLIDKRADTNSGYAGDVLRDLARNYLDFTVVGSRLLVAEELSFGPFAQLRDEHFTVDLEVEERGTETGTKWWVAGDDLHGTGVLGSCGGDDEFYGLIERIASEDSVKTQDNADRAACNHLRGTNPTPIYVNIPEGASLSPQAPVRFDQLVPGALFDVILEGYCRRLTVRTLLTALNVTLEPDEKVGVTLAPKAISEETVSRGSVS